MSHASEYAIRNSAKEHAETDRDGLKAQFGSRCTLPDDTENRLQGMAYSNRNSGSRTLQGKIKCKNNAPKANSPSHTDFPNRRPFNQVYRADPSVFPYPRDSNLGNTEFEQSTLNQIAEADDIRAHREHKRMTSSLDLQAPSFAMNPKASVFTPSQLSQWPSPVVDAEDSVACYPPPLSLSGESAVIANNGEVTGGSAPQMEGCGYDATSQPPDGYSSEAERAFCAAGQAELDRMMERWETDDAKYDPQSHWRNYTPRITEPKLVLPAQIDLFGSLHGITYDPNYKAYIGDGYPRSIPTRPDGSGPCTEEPLISAQRTASQAANPTTGPITDILHVQTEAHVKEGMKDFGTNSNRPVERLRLCLCDRKWYSALLMERAGHVCVDSSANAEREIGRRIMWGDLVRQGLAPGQPTVGQGLEGRYENDAVAPGSGQVAEYAERDVTGTAVKSKKSSNGKEEGEENEFKGVIVRDFAVEGEGRAYAYDA